MGERNIRQVGGFATTPRLPTQGKRDIFLPLLKFADLSKRNTSIEYLFSPFNVRSPRRNFYGTLTSLTKVKDACISSPVRALCSSLKASKVAKKSRSASSIVAPSPKNPKGNCSLQYTLYHPAPLLSTCASYSFI